MVCISLLNCCIVTMCNIVGSKYKDMHLFSF